MTCRHPRAQVEERLLPALEELVEQTLFELCSRLAMKHDLTPTRQAVSQHLDVLQEAGLVEVERRGRYKLHTINTAPLAQIAERWPTRKASS